MTGIKRGYRDEEMRRGVERRFWDWNEIERWESKGVRVLKR